MLRAPEAPPRFLGVADSPLAPLDTVRSNRWAAFSLLIALRRKLSRKPTSN